MARFSGSVSRPPKTPNPPAVRPAPRSLGKSARSGANNAGAQLIPGGAIIPSIRIPKGGNIVTTGPKSGTTSSGRAPSSLAMPYSPGLPKGTFIG